MNPYQITLRLKSNLKGFTVSMKYNQNIHPKIINQSIVVLISDKKTKFELLKFSMAKNILEQIPVII